MSTKRLDYLTRALVLKLRTAQPDLSMGELASACGVSESSARRILQSHTTDARLLTRELLVSGVLDRLDDWARAARIAATKGYHHPSKEWLEAAQVTDAKPIASVDARTSVIVNIPFQLGALSAPGPAESARILPAPIAPPDTGSDT